MTEPMYCIVRQHEDGSQYVFAKTMGLPERIQLPDGYTRTSLDELPEEERKALGVLPLEVIGSSYDPEVETRDEGTFSIQEDKVVLTYIVTPLPADVLTERQTVSLAQAKTSKYRAVKALRFSPEKQAVFYEHESTEYLMHADEKTYGNLTGLVWRLSSDENALPRTWYFDDGQKLEVGLTEASAMLKLIIDTYQHILDTEDMHGAAINSLTTVEAVASYDITTGW